MVRSAAAILLPLVAAATLTVEPARAESELSVARQPAEFEPLDAVWIIWPPVDHLAGYSNEQVVVEIVEAVAPHTPVKITAATAELAKKARTALTRFVENGSVEILELPSIEFWTRDMGPVFVETTSGEKAIADFAFDAWGYGDPSEEETQVEEKYDERVAEQQRLPCISSPLISEGGDREVNGRGTLMVVESVELGRNPEMSRDEIEAELRRMLGIKKVIWLKQGLREDDHTFLGPIGEHEGLPIYTAVTTNGHIDEFARFVNPTTILLGEVPSEDLDDPIARENHKRLEVNHDILRRATDQDGNPFKIIRMPLPRTVFETMRPGDSVYDYISTLDYRDGSTFPKGEPVAVVAAGSYLNFLITDKVVVGQKFWREGGDPVVKARDATAKRILQEAFPNRKVVLIDALAVNFGGGGIHCITMQEPRIGD